MEALGPLESLTRLHNPHIGDLDLKGMMAGEGTVVPCSRDHGQLGRAWAAASGPGPGSLDSLRGRDVCQ